MSALIGHAKAAQILATAFLEKALELKKEPKAPESVSLGLWGMGEAYALAADRMEAAMRAEATGNQGEGT